MRRCSLLAGCAVFLIAASCMSIEFYSFDAAGLTWTLDRFFLVGLVIAFVVQWRLGRTEPKRITRREILLVSFVGCAMVVLTSVALLPLFRDLPQAVLGAIVISAVIGFLRVDELRRISTIRRDSFVLSIVALVTTLVLGILPGLVSGWLARAGTLFGL